MPTKAQVARACAAIQAATHNQNGYKFSDIRCKAGPTYKGKQTILVYVTIAHAGKVSVALVWEDSTGTVINSGRVPSYSYIPPDVKAVALANSGSTKFKA